jgi:hypothetical protein
MNGAMNGARNEELEAEVVELRKQLDEMKASKE